ncbi:hypothetical protein E2P81_ATG06116 [Venturia nashicola]|nr:hypothetical protein E2P81_ATG06116 [Venturia nashicola]
MPFSSVFSITSRNSANHIERRHQKGDTRRATQEGRHKKGDTRRATQEGRHKKGDTRRATQGRHKGRHKVRHKGRHNQGETNTFDKVQSCLASSALNKQ